jgi:triosephosphate isomerase
MKSLYIIGNWKSNKTVRESEDWLRTFRELVSKERILPHIQIILCVPFTVLYAIKTFRDAHRLSFLIGAQDVSPYPEGAFTGEESARMIRELADWVLIGHSERRRFMNESDEELHFECSQAKEAGLSIVFNVPDCQTSIPPFVDIVAYEPPSSIGTGKPETPTEAEATIDAIKKRTNIPTVIYGGSVLESNVSEMLKQPSIDGVIVGGASLDPDNFVSIIRQAVVT